MFALCNFFALLCYNGCFNKLPISKLGSYIHFYDIVLFNNVKIVIILFSTTASNNGCKLKHYYNRAILNILKTVVVTYLT